MTGDVIQIVVALAVVVMLVVVERRTRPVHRRSRRAVRRNPRCGCGRPHPGPRRRKC